ncbi:hypothetical protein HK102_003974 [Quaeritorhiza haematococci]|nr:hypothetical protein HK102_003974 [Quaeritorhiza haematococci]
MHLIKDLSQMIHILVTKVKDYAKVDAVLQVLLAISSMRDGQMAMLKVEGLVTQLVSLLSRPVRTTVLFIIRNLLTARESKAHFLVEDAFLPQLFKVLEMKSLRNIALGTGLIWVLIHDSEKSKVALRKAQCRDKLEQLEHRLHREYSSLLQGLNSPVAGYQDPQTSPSSRQEADQDGELLRQILHNVSTVYKLLKSYTGDR